MIAAETATVGEGSSTTYVTLCHGHSRQGDAASACFGDVQPGLQADSLGNESEVKDGVRLAM